MYRFRINFRVYILGSVFGIYFKAYLYMHESTHTVACMNDLALLHFFRSSAGFLEAHGLVSQFQGQGEATKRAAGDETKRRWRSGGSRWLFWGTNLSSNVGHG